MKSAFIRTLEKAAYVNDDIFLLTADLGFNQFDRFRDSFPGRFINVGIAESNMIGIAAGLALSGKNVYCYSIIPFLIMRSLERIRVDLCQPDLNVKLIGAGGGLVYGCEGMTHHAIEDIAIMRCLPNMSVVVPADAMEVEATIRESVEHKGPLFIRIGREGEPRVHHSIPEFKIGRGLSVTKEGRDICIFTTGTILYVAVDVCKMLLNEGLNVSLISMHTVKPLDNDIIKLYAGSSKAIFTIEEHSIIGGLGSAASDILMELNYKGLFRKIGLPDEYCKYIGRQDYLLKQYNLTPEKIKDFILAEYEQIQNN
jgi:transketolase